MKARPNPKNLNDKKVHGASKFTMLYKALLVRLTLGHLFVPRREVIVPAEEI